MPRRKREFTLEAGEATTDRQFVTALARGLEVLRAFRPGEADLSNQEIAERTKLSKPTVSRLTHTLIELGYLTQSRASGRYQLGPGVLALGYSMIAGVEVRERARPLMEELAVTSDATVAIGERGMEQAIRDLERQGFVTSFGDWRPDVNAIGVPVQSLNRERFFGLICGGPSFTASAEYLSEKIGPRLVKMASDLSAPPETFAPALAAR